ncbi:MAG TPA: beta-ketoacyl synthase N-terminal-like domain-containing protein, partial [Anaerolineaceae bacterium]
MSENLSPLKQAFLAIEELQAKLEAAQGNSTPIAVIGMGCRLPGGANDPETFWKNLKNGVDGVRDVPAERWDIDAVYDPDPDAPGKTYVRQAGFIDGIDQFDPQFFGIAPREAHSMDPQQRLVLEVAWEALEHAAIAPTSLHGTKTGVFLGIASADYANLFIKTNDPTALDTYYGSGISHSIASGRLSYVLGLQGPSISIDTACSSSLVATHLAVQSLRTGDSDLALAGGVNLILLPDNQISFSRLRMLSSDGRCKTFDAAADGFGDGEGCGVVVLKRLPDALRDGDRILAVIRGSAINQDGASSGLTAPNGPSQEVVIRTALANAGIAPAEVGYVEAHGTGTSLGDPIEVRALGNVLKEGRPAERPFYLGSVKTNVGHLEAGAGIASLMKTVLMLQHGEIPPHLHFSTPNPLIAWDEIPVFIPTALTPWPAEYGRRIAGVSAFGFSGTNAHLVLEAAPAPEAKSPAAVERPLHLLALSARNTAALRELAQRYQQFLAAHPEISLADAAYSANTGRAKLGARLTVTAQDPTQARERLAAFLAREDAPGIVEGMVESSDPPKVAFLFTGQGAQYVGMGRQLYQTQPVFRAALDRCDALLREHLGESLLAILYPPEGSPASSKIDQTAVTQPALFAIEYALAQLWMAWGVIPSAVMGHSLGEYVAAVLAGVFSLEDGIKLIAARGRLMGGLPEGGAMVSIFAPAEAVQAAIGDRVGVSIAAVNGLDSTVISGDEDGVQAVAEVFTAQGIKTRKLNVSHAFHSHRMEPMLEAFERIAATLRYSQPRLRLISDVTGEVARGAQVANARYWRDHVRQPVQFLAAIQTLYREGYSVFVEIGPNPTLAGMGQRILDDPQRPLIWATSLKQNQDDWGQMLNGLGRVFTAGGNVDWAAFDAPYPRRKLALPTYPFQRSRYWVQFERPATAAPARHTGQNIHPLLGERLRSPSSTVTFENWLTTAAFSFLNDHRIDGTAILPGTAYIECALAAGQILFGGAGCQVEDLTIHTALAVPDGEERLMQITAAPQDDGSLALDVYTQAGEDDPWLRHASALLRKAETAAEQPGIDLDEIQARCSETRTAEAHYQQLMQTGLAFGAGLHGVEQIWRRDGEALGKIGQTAAASESGYLLHPALLDAHLQVVAAALPASDAIYLPLNFEKIERLSTAAPVWSHVQTGESASRETIHAELEALDENGQPVLRLSGITLKRAERAALRQPGADPYRDWLYAVDWQAAPLETPAQKQVVSPLQLAARLDPNLLRLYQENNLNEYVTDLLPEFDRLSRIYITNALLKLGWRPVVGQRFTPAALAEQLRIIPQHRRLIGYLLRILQEDGYLRADGEEWEVQRVPQAENAQTLHQTLLKLFPEYGGELEITGRCGSTLAECLNGTADPLQALFPGGSLDTAERIYQKSPAALTYNGLVREVVNAIQEFSAAAAPTPQNKLRVLEIGAGTGGTTAFVLPLFPAPSTEYTFTDISPLFPARAKQKFSQYPFLRYQALDIEKDPAGQGLGGQQFDLIIAANVIHATQDLRVTLRHVRQLLAPGGLFIMLEVTAPQRWVDITFGLTDGWWRFADKDLRPDYPLLSRPRWAELLQASGFAEAATIPQVGGEVERSVLEQAVIIARAPAPADALGGEKWLV